ncbi:hypothetical protein Mgra_00000389 [Meloidogyne graminicola]|uniref:Uncharacterized protein n=1 Tax=Meloidogyne graminicola TaxID=189291 RepID=A0A8T0A293_9BILA|nr:hypothetical protein Mgra_00000389 [Meloidogyne graminicola]
MAMVRRHAIEDVRRQQLHVINMSARSSVTSTSWTQGALFLRGALNDWWRPVWFTF